LIRFTAGIFSGAAPKRKTFEKKYKLITGCRARRQIVKPGGNQAERKTGYDRGK